MTDRDRLIEILKVPIHPKIGVDPAEVVADHLLANGVTLLPLPIGSTVYEIRARGERSYKHREYDYGIPTNFALHNAIEMGAELYIAPKKFTKSDSVRLNKTVFLTKEEAEAELRKRGEQNAQ